MSDKDKIEIYINNCWWYTKQQKQMLMLIYNHNGLKAKPLGLREIAKELNTTPTSVSQRLKILESYEVIKIGKEYTTRRARNIQLDKDKMRKCYDLFN